MYLHVVVMCKKSTSNAGTAMSMVFPFTSTQLLLILICIPSARSGFHCRSYLKMVLCFLVVVYNQALASPGRLHRMDLDITY